MQQENRPIEMLIKEEFEKSKSILPNHITPNPLNFRPRAIQGNNIKNCKNDGRQDIR